MITVRTSIHSLGLLEIYDDLRTLVELTCQRRNRKEAFPDLSDGPEAEQRSTFTLRRVQDVLQLLNQRFHALGDGSGAGHYVGLVQRLQRGAQVVLAVPDQRQTEVAVDRLKALGPKPRRKRRLSRRIQPQGASSNVVIVTDEVLAWFEARLPKTWFEGPPEVTADGDEILVVGSLPDVELARGTLETARAAARAARIDRFREETREDRVRLAREAERHFRKKVGWGARCGDQLRLFTTISVPVMTRLRMPERSILDTLVAGGVARSRSDALAWCVRLVGMHQADWIKGLRDALVKVDEVRSRGPLN
jgi:hypothetical protein